jgi:hypothetical protein
MNLALLLCTVPLNRATLLGSSVRLWQRVSNHDELMKISFCHIKLNHYKLGILYIYLQIHIFNMLILNKLIVDIFGIIAL